MDPLALVSGMAAVTKNISFGITGSTSYINVSSLSRRTRMPLTPLIPSLSHSSWPAQQALSTMLPKVDLRGMWLPATLEQQPGMIVH